MQEYLFTSFKLWRRALLIHAICRIRNEYIFSLKLVIKGPHNTVMHSAASDVLFSAASEVLFLPSEVSNGYVCVVITGRRISLHRDPGTVMGHEKCELIRIAYKNVLLLV
jgi:hypothetical protein